MQTIKEVYQELMKLVGEVTLSLAAILWLMTYLNAVTITHVKNTFIITIGQ